MKPLTHWLLETLLGRLVELDEHAGHALAALGERLIVLEVLPSGPRLLLRLSGGRVEVTHADAARPEARLAGRPAALTRALLAGAAPPPGASGRWNAPGPGLLVEGDVELLGRFVAIVRDLDPDWEDRLARLTGDVPARLIGNAVRDASRFGRGLLATLGLDVTEYLQHESRLVPSRPEWDAFAADVQRLQEACERLARRVQDLERRLDVAGPGRA